MNEEKVVDVIKRLATTNTSTKRDEIVIEYVLKELGYANARVVSGIVYLDGRGTLQNPPTSIHAVAKALMPLVNKEE
jgi:hypothetical protein